MDSLSLNPNPTRVRIDYLSTNIRGVYECSFCGSLVGHMEAHTRWHSSVLMAPAEKVREEHAGYPEFSVGGGKQVPERLCLARPHVPHEPHDWWYTSSGGGHEMSEPDESGRERNQKQWRCPGVPAGETVP